jgi:hypothetical protein
MQQRGVEEERVTLRERYLCGGDGDQGERREGERVRG